MAFHRHAAAVLAGGLLVFGCVGCSSSSDEPTRQADSPEQTVEREQSADQLKVAAEIDRVVAGATDASTAVLRGPVTRGTVAGHVEAMVRCADFGTGRRYCLTMGWTDQTEDVVQAHLVKVAQKALRAQQDPDRVEPESTGDVTLLGLVEQKAAMTTEARAAADREELEDAAEVSG